MRERIALGLGLVLVAGAFVAALSDSARRRSGSNATVRKSGNLLAVTPGQRSCQSEPLIPADTAALRTFFRFRPSGPGGPLEITISRAGRTLAAARLPAGVSAGSPRVSIAPVARDTRGAMVCFANRGTRTVQFAGNATPELGGSNPTGARLGDVVRIDYVRRGSETWWRLAPVVARRFGTVKPSFVGSWTMYAVFGVFALLCAAGIGLLVGRRRS